MPWNSSVAQTTTVSSTARALRRSAGVRASRETSARSGGKAPRSSPAEHQQGQPRAQQGKDQGGQGHIKAPLPLTQGDTCDVGDHAVEGVVPPGGRPCSP